MRSEQIGLKLFDLAVPLVASASVTTEKSNTFRTGRLAVSRSYHMGGENESPKGPDSARERARVSRGFGICDKSLSIQNTCSQQKKPTSQ